MVSEVKIYEMNKYDELSHDKSLVELLKENDSFTYRLLHLDKLSDYELNYEGFIKHIDDYIKGETDVFDESKKRMLEYVNRGLKSFPEIINELQHSIVFSQYGFENLEFLLSRSLDFLVPLNLFTEDWKKVKKEGEEFFVKGYINRNDYTRDFVKRWDDISGRSLYFTSRESKNFLKKSLKELEEVSFKGDLSLLMQVNPLTFALDESVEDVIERIEPYCKRFGNKNKIGYASLWNHYLPGSKTFTVLLDEESFLQEHDVDIYQARVQFLVNYESEEVLFLPKIDPVIPKSFESVDEIYEELTDSVKNKILNICG